MVKEREIHSVLDILKLTPEEFARFLPDLVTWYEFGRDMEANGAEMTGLVWVDDGRPGEIHSVLATITSTGEQQVWHGSAYQEPSA